MLPRILKHSYDDVRPLFTVSSQYEISGEKEIFRKNASHIVTNILEETFITYHPNVVLVPSRSNVFLSCDRIQHVEHEN